MFGKVKKWLGIEGVKVELDLPDFAFRKVECLTGRIRFYSQNAQKVTAIRLALVEKYSRGRGEDRRIDEYRLGEMELKEEIEVPAEEIIEIEFTLPFAVMESDMDSFGNKNIFAGGLAKLAKTLNKVDSNYFVEVEATVEGTALNPFERAEIELR